MARDDVFDFLDAKSDTKERTGKLRLRSKKIPGVRQDIMDFLGPEPEPEKGLVGETLDFVGDAITTSPETEDLIPEASSFIPKGEFARKGQIFGQEAIKGAVEPLIGGVELLTGTGGEKGEQEQLINPFLMPEELARLEPQTQFKALQEFRESMVSQEFLSEPRTSVADRLVGAGGKLAGILLPLSGIFKVMRAVYPAQSIFQAMFLEGMGFAALSVLEHGSELNPKAATYSFGFGALFPVGRYMKTRKGRAMLTSSLLGAYEAAVGGLPKDIDDVERFAFASGLGAVFGAIGHTTRGTPWSASIAKHAKKRASIESLKLLRDELTAHLKELRAQSQRLLPERTQTQGNVPNFIRVADQGPITRPEVPGEPFPHRFPDDAPTRPEVRVGQRLLGTDLPEPIGPERQLGPGDRTLRIPDFVRVAGPPGVPKPGPGEPFPLRGSDVLRTEAGGPRRLLGPAPEDIAGPGGFRLRGRGQVGGGPGAVKRALMGRGARDIVPEHGGTGMGTTGEAQAATRGAARRFSGADENPPLFRDDIIREDIVKATEQKGQEIYEDYGQEITGVKAIQEARVMEGVVEGLRAAKLEVPAKRPTRGSTPEVFPPEKPPTEKTMEGLIDDAALLGARTVSETEPILPGKAPGTPPRDLGLLEADLAVGRAKDVTPEEVVARRVEVHEDFEATEQIAEDVRKAAHSKEGLEPAIPTSPNEVPTVGEVFREGRRMQFWETDSPRLAFDQVLRGADGNLYALHQSGVEVVRVDTAKISSVSQMLEADKVIKEAPKPEPTADEGSIKEFEDSMAKELEDLGEIPLDAMLKEVEGNLESLEMNDVDYLYGGPPLTTKYLKPFTEKFHDVFNIEAQFKRRGAPELGFQVKNWFSNMELHQTRALTRVLRIRRLDPTPAEEVQAILAAENKNIFSESNPKVQELAKDLREYLDFYKELYQARGFTEADFVGNLKERLEKQLQEVGSTKDTAEIREILQLIEDGKLDFVHIPSIRWFEGKILRDPVGSRKILNFMVQQGRKSFTIEGLIRDKLIDPSEIRLHDVYGSYGRRAGRDFALMAIREGAIKDGVASAKEAPGKIKVEGDMARRMPAFKDMFVDEWFLKYLDDFTTTAGKYHRMGAVLSELKMLQFFNPLFLPAYDMWQGIGLGTFKSPRVLSKAPADLFTIGRAVGRKAVGGRTVGESLELSPRIKDKTAGAILKGVHAYVNRTPEFYRAGRHGLLSKPFSAPQDDFFNVVLRTREGHGLVTVLKRAARLGRTGFVTKLPVLNELYNYSWQTAWWLDGNIRMISETYLREVKGFTPREAAQEAALAHADYASVPPRTRQWLNRIFFTPTFKIVMARWYTSMVQAAFKVAAEPLSLGKIKTTPVEKVRAQSLVAIAGVVLGIDYYFTSQGWNRSVMGVRYTLPMVDERTGETKEMVVSVPNSLTLALKFGGRAFEAWRREGISMEALGQFLIMNRWELVPWGNAMMRVAENRNGEVFTPRLEHTGKDPVLTRQAGQIATFLTRELIAITRIGLDFVPGLKPEGPNIPTREELKASLPGIIEVLQTLRMAYAYKRASPEGTVSWQIDKLTKAVRKLARHGKLTDDIIKNFHKELEKIKQPFQPPRKDEAEAIRMQDIGPLRRKETDVLRRRE
ncbi:MAG: hypothetical protein J3T61_00465 [Candidatus Brocadiales bacterium]|nr:hypothetical protein [Candidatus Bathyanammoxibius sp.]